MVVIGQMEPAPTGSICTPPLKFSYAHRGMFGNRRAVVELIFVGIGAWLGFNDFSRKGSMVAIVEEHGRGQKKRKRVPRL